MGIDENPDRSRQLLAFGLTLKNMRMERGHSQEEFADLCGLDRTYVGGIERGERNVGLVNVHRLADALRVPVSALFLQVEGGADTDGER